MVWREWQWRWSRQRRESASLLTPSPAVEMAMALTQLAGVREEREPGASATVTELGTPTATLQPGAPAQFTFTLPGSLAGLVDEVDEEEDESSPLWSMAQHLRQVSETFQWGENGEPACPRCDGPVNSWGECLEQIWNYTYQH